MKKEMDLAGLNKQADDLYERQKARLREHYKYARELGFSAAQATVLQTKSKALIEKLAAQLPHQKPKED